MTPGCRRATPAVALATACLVVLGVGITPGVAGSPTWTRAPDMSIARRGASVTLLGGPRCQAAAAPAWCGTVLVAGGGVVSGGPYDKSSELYDPMTGTWSSTGAMLVPRWGHRAVQLLDGRVLVVNGISETATSHGASNLSSAELYDPDAGTWSAAGSLTQARGTSMVAALISGPATSCGANCGKVLVVGGQLNNSVSASNTAEIYEPALDRWRPTAPMSLGRVVPAIVPIAPGDPSVCGSACGNILLIGGNPLAPAGNPSSLTAELFDPVDESWRLTGPLAGDILVGSAAQLASGKVLALDRESTGTTKAAQVFDPVTTTWSKTSTMTARGSVTALPNGTALAVLGGSAQIYNPATNGWTDTDAPLPGAAIVNVDDAPLLACRSKFGRVLVAGDMNDYEKGAQLYPGVASLYGIAPPTGSVGGGERVQLAGVGLSAGPSSIKIRFGDKDGLNPVAFPDGSAIDVTTPAGMAGTVDVSVTIDGLPVEVCGPHAFRYESAPAPPTCPGPSCPVVTEPPLEVTSVRPSSGPVAGGTSVAVRGRGFTAVTDVSFGDVDVTTPCSRTGTTGGVGCFSVLSDTAADVVSPAHPAGPVHVRVRTGRGVSPATAADVFTFVVASVASTPDPTPSRGGPPVAQAETPVNPSLPGPSAGPATANVPAPSSALSPSSSPSPGQAGAPGHGAASIPAGSPAPGATPGGVAGHAPASSTPAALAPGGAAQGSPLANPVVDRVRDPGADVAPSYKMVSQPHYDGPPRASGWAVVPLVGAVCGLTLRRRRAEFLSLYTPAWARAMVHDGPETDTTHAQLRP